MVNKNFEVVCTDDPSKASQFYVIPNDDDDDQFGIAYDAKSNFELSPRADSRGWYTYVLNCRRSYSEVDFTTFWSSSVPHSLRIELRGWLGYAM